MCCASFLKSIAFWSPGDSLDNQSHARFEEKKSTHEIVQFYKNTLTHIHTHTHSHTLTHTANKNETQTQQNFNTQTNYYLIEIES